MGNDNVTYDFTTVQMNHALNSKGELVHISDSVDGEVYRCKDTETCNSIVHRIMGDKYAHHYRHEKSSIGALRCNYCEETEIHKRSKELLQQCVSSKFFVCPPIVKGTKEKEFILIPDEVQNEVAFYINEIGGVSWCKAIDYIESPKRKKMIVVDSVFFLKGKPILLIEIFYTHKVDSDKLAKIRELQYDTIEISIPKHVNINTELEGIVIDKFGNKEWLFNNKRESNQYDSTTATRDNYRTLSQINKVDGGKCFNKLLLQIIGQIAAFMASSAFAEYGDDCERKRTEVSDSYSGDEERIRRDIERQLKIGNEIKGRVHSEFESRRSAVRSATAIEHGKRSEVRKTEYEIGERRERVSELRRDFLERYREVEKLRNESRCFHERLTAEISDEFKDRNNEQQQLAAKYNERRKRDGDLRSEIKRGMSSAFDLERRESGRLGDLRKAIKVRVEDELEREFKREEDELRGWEEIIEREGDRIKAYGCRVYHKRDKYSERYRNELNERISDSRRKTENLDTEYTQFQDNITRENERKCNIRHEINRIEGFNSIK